MKNKAEIILWCIGVVLCVFGIFVMKMHMTAACIAWLFGIVFLLSVPAVMRMRK